MLEKMFRLFPQRTDMLEKRIEEVTAKLEAEYTMNRSRSRSPDRHVMLSEQPGRYMARTQPDIMELEERLRRAENELAAGDVMRDSLRQDKERVIISEYRLRRTVIICLCNLLNPHFSY